MSQAGCVGAIVVAATPSFMSQRGCVRNLAIVVAATVEAVAVVELLRAVLAVTLVTVIKVVDEVATTPFTGSALGPALANKAAAVVKTVADDAFAGVNVVLPTPAGGGGSGGSDWHGLGRGG